MPEELPEISPTRNRIVAIIPARLASSRLPGKVLRPLAGTPMLGWVVRAALSCPLLDRVLVATDSPEVDRYVRSQGWASILTSSDLASGTDRVCAAAAAADADLYVNIQGDEPLLRPEHIEALLHPFARDGVQVTTLSTPCSREELHNPNAVKVVTALDGRALYFSRHAIPYRRETEAETGAEIETDTVCRKHLGFYAYRKAALQRFAELPPSPLEQTERLEQLRLLENGIAIYVEPAPFDTIGVDTEEDLARAEKLLDHFR